MTYSPSFPSKLAGSLFLLAIITYGTGDALLQALISEAESFEAVLSHFHQWASGSLLMFLNSLIVLSIGIIFYPLLKIHHEGIALGYVLTRLLEAVLLSVGIIFLLSVLPVLQGQAGNPKTLMVGQGMSYHLAMLSLGLGSLPFCWLIWRTGLVPPWLGGWGMAGYFLLALGAVLEVMGWQVGWWLAIPGGLFEGVFACWLMAKGSTEIIAVR